MDRQSDRRTWMADRRAAVVATYDALRATYDAEHSYPNEVQEEWVRRLVDTCPPGGLVLDAPCGSGRYFPIVVGAGRRVVGIDQSAGMLAAAEAKHRAEACTLVGLQEIDFDGEFDGSITVDAMENVPPEDWPVVLANLRRAVRPGGHLYLTVEEGNRERIDEAYATLVAAGAPAVPGEVIEGGVAGYHHYPFREQVLTWISDAGLAVIDERFVQEEPTWGYRHLMLVRPGTAAG